MANVNPGPANVQTPNATAAVNAPQGGPKGLTFATLPTGSQISELAYTTDSGLCYFDGTNWNPIATVANISTAVANVTSSITTAQKDQQRLLAVGKGLNVNAGIGDIGVLPVINSSRWNVVSVVAGNLTANAGTSVAIAFCSATAGAAVTIVAPKILSSIVGYGGTTTAYQFTVQNVSFVGTGTTIYVNCQTTAGATCTLDVFIYGFDMSV